jgi:hypothetical protein
MQFPIRDMINSKIQTRHFMKKPLHLLAYSLLCLTILAGGFHFISSEEHEEGGEEEGIPGVLRSMDLWSEMRTYPNKTLEGTRYGAAFRQASRMSLAARGMSSGREHSTTTAPWVALAPKNFAGRVLSLGFHPTDPNIMWVGSASGGLWKTTTGGTGAPGGINWTYVPTGFPVLGVYSIAVQQFIWRQCRPYCGWPLPFVPWHLWRRYAQDYRWR